MATSKGARTSPKKAKTAKKPALPKGRTASFQYHAPDAHAVTLAGDFNSWDPQTQALHRDEHGTWTVSLTLKPGSYQYKFVVDGDWREDHSNPNRVWTAEGVCNSVIEVS